MLLSRLANRDYTTSQLKNELEYTLIKCPSAPKASIAVSIAMGHFSDPDDCQGLSHLMEHMVFAGSKNYPDGNYLNQLLKGKGKGNSKGKKGKGKKGNSWSTARPGKQGYRPGKGKGY